MQNQPVQREYGLDIYRILAMMLITALHVVYYHLGMQGADKAAGLFETGLFVRYGASLADDCFALLSGYLFCSRSSSYNLQWVHKIFNFLSKLFFWSILLCLLCLLVCPETLQTSQVHKLYVLFPPFYPQAQYWWYVSAYIGLLLFIPMLLYVVHHLDKKNLLVLSGLLFLFFSCIGTMFFSSGSIALQRGYSSLWLITCFLWGAAIKLYAGELLECRYLRRYLIPGVLLLFVFSYAISFIPPLRRIQGMFTFLTAPWFVGEAILLLLYCRSIRISSVKVQKLLRFLSVNALGVYLFHTHPLIMAWIFHKTKNPHYTLPEYLARLLIITAGLYIIGILMKFLIDKVYEKLRISQLLMLILEKMYQKGAVIIPALKRQFQK